MTDEEYKQYQIGNFCESINDYSYQLGIEIEQATKIDDDFEKLYKDWKTFDRKLEKLIIKKGFQKPI